VLFARNPRMGRVFTMFLVALFTIFNAKLKGRSGSDWKIPALKKIAVVLGFYL